MRTRRWTLCLVACAASAFAVQWAGAQVAAERKPPDTTGRPPLEVQLETLRPRAPTGQTADPFEARSWAPPPGSTTPQRRTTPVKRAPPPLPFAYLGRIVDGDATVVMLARENVSYTVRLGDTLARDYRVTRIGDDGVTLRYLPLNVDQTLSYRADAPGPGSPTAARPAPAVGRDDRPLAAATRATTEPPVFTGALAGAIDSDLVLGLNAPDRVAIGAEFEVGIDLSGDSQGASATVEVAYDPSVLRALHGAAAAPTASGAPPPDPGRAVVDLVAPQFAGARAAPMLVRFRVVASGPTTTSVRVTTLSGTRADGRPVAIAAPDAIDLAIVTTPTPR